MTMYVPQHAEENRLDVLHQLIRSQALGVWVSLAEGGLQANHIPFSLDISAGGNGILRGHVARANPIWQQTCATESLLIFQGPQAYVSPSWMPSKHQHGKRVPTWNYAVVHARGQAVFIDDSQWLLAQVDKLTRTHEAAQALPWRVSDAPAEFTDKMLQAIVGVEIPIRALTGKWKLSRNHSAADQGGVIAGLEGAGEAQSLALASLMAAEG